MDLQPIMMSVGRDYRVGVGAGVYEYCLFRGDELVGRQGGFRSSTQAKRAGAKAGQAMESAEFEAASRAAWAAEDAAADAFSAAVYQAIRAGIPRNSAKAILAAGQTVDTFIEAFRARMAGGPLPMAHVGD